MHEMDTVARREDPAKPTSGLDAKRVADMSRVSAKARDDLWQRAMKNSPRAEGLRDNNARKAAQRIVKEIRARRNPISFDGTEFEHLRKVTGHLTLSRSDQMPVQGPTNGLMHRNKQLPPSLQRLRDYGSPNSPKFMALACRVEEPPQHQERTQVPQRPVQAWPCGRWPNHHHYSGRPASLKP